jgi:hypothetical protein
MVVLERKALTEPSGKDSSHGKYFESSKLGESHDVGKPYILAATSSTNHTPDRFMRDTVRCCHGAKRFLLLHHTTQHRRPLGSGNTVCLVLWPWSPVLDHYRRMASPSCFLFSKKTLHLVIQYSCRAKEEIENW